MAGFELRGHMLGAQNPMTYDCLITNSQSVGVGDAVVLSGGYVLRASAAGRIWGIVVGIVDAKGIDLDNTKDSLDGTWVSSTKVYTAGDDNVTDDKIKAKVVADPFAIFYNDSDGSLTAADDWMLHDLASYRQASATEVAVGSGGQLQLIGRDPDNDADASKGLWRIAEWQGFAPALV